MSRDDIQKLLGGYATGTLTPEEQQVLFEAALEDQELFDALAREEALREVLSDPASRAHLLAAMEEAPAPWYRRWSGLWPRAIPIGALAAILLMVGITLRQGTHEPEAQQVAKVELPRAPLPLPKVESQNVPILPPPPEPRRLAPPSLTPRPLPGVTPMAAPPPPPATAAAAPAQQFATTNGALPAPMVQQLQQSQIGNAFLPTNNFVQGVVTDPTGARVRSATVELKSPATGQVTTAQTNAQGEFRVGATPGTNYQISASAPGFRTTTASAVTPPTGEPQPVNLRLDVGAATETVVVSGGALLADGHPATASRDDIVSLNGVVTDANGLVIPLASVAVKSLATGKEARTSTDEKGQFKTEVTGSAYQITASKKGFETKTVVESASAAPVNVQMDAAPTAAAAPASAGGRGGRGGGGGARAGLAGAMASAAKAKVAPAALEYHLLQLAPSGEWQEVKPNATVPAGANLLVRITPPADGSLRIEDSAGNTILNSPRAQSGIAGDSRLPAYTGPGPMELRIYFSPQGTAEKDQAPAATFKFTIR